jgi:hypothetical protein
MVAELQHMRLCTYPGEQLNSLKFTRLGGTVTRDVTVNIVQAVNDGTCSQGNG